MSRPNLLRLTSALTLLACLAACGGPQGASSSSQHPAVSGTPGRPGSPNGSPSAPAPMPAELLRFKGLAAPELVKTLGDPSFRRREAPAEIWQYYGQGCVLDLFLYDEAGTKRVSHAELRSRNPEQILDSACLAQLLAGKRGQPGS